MSIRLSHAFVSVHDQDEALTFYRDALGLEVINDVVFDSYRWLALRAKDQPDVEVVLEPAAMAHPADAQTLRELMAKGSLTGLIFQVDSVDETFERLQAAGFEVLQEPIDQGYGVRDCAFRDPSGNMVRFSAPLAA